MNKKAEDYLRSKSIIARKLIDDKEFYEEIIEREDESKAAAKDEYTRGIEAGVVVAFEFAARDIKTTLQFLLEEVHRSE